MFDYSNLRHRVTIRVGANFQLKNPIDILQFHKVQVWLNVLRICKQKISERGISRKHSVK